MILSDVAIKNRTTVFVGIIMIVLAGAVSYNTLPRESSPEIKIPYVIITTTDGDKDPAEMEKNVTDKIEKELGSIRNKKKMTSTTLKGMSQIVIEFESGTNIDEVIQRVKDKVDLAKPHLPKNSDEPVEPVVNEINLAEEPIVIISMCGNLSQARMKDYAEDLEEELEKIQGVLGIDVVGALERVIRYEIDPYKLASHGIKLNEVGSFITKENKNTSAGGIEGSDIKTSVRVIGEINEPAELATFPIAVRDSKTIMPLDVGSIHDTFKDRQTYSRTNNVECVTLLVKKRVGANIIDIVKQVKSVISDFEKRAPKGLTFQIIDDRSKDINAMLIDLENNIMSGLVLVIGVLFLFMGLRTSLIVATAIPLSMLMSFAILQALGVTLNMVVLFALILALGMLVDNAIVIVENIYRYMELGFGKLEAARRGTAEVAWPVIASTATTIAAFFPLLFWPGVMGGFMKFIPITLIVVLTSSLIVAMMISPVLCSIFGKPGKHKDPNAPDHWFVKGYRALQHTALTHPITTLFLSTCLLAGVIIFYGAFGKGVEVFPNIDPNKTTINILAPQGTSIEESNRLSTLVAQRIAPLATRKDGSKCFEFVIEKVGGGGGQSTEGGSSKGTHNTDIQIIFPDFEDRVDKQGTPWFSADVLKELRKVVSDIPGAEIKVEKQREGPSNKSPITVQIIGDDLQELKKLNQKALALIRSVSGVINLKSDMEAQKPELAFYTHKEKAAKLNFSNFSVSTAMQTCLYGRKVGEYRTDDDTYDIRVRGPYEFRSNLQDLINMPIPNAQGHPAPISMIGRFDYKPGLGAIYHIEEKRAVTITADVQEGTNANQIRGEVQKLLAKKLNLPPRFRVQYAGQQEEQEETQNFLSKAFVIALLLIVLILVTQFNTLMVPFIIMITIILSLIGVFIGLLVFEMPFGIVMTGVGVISLAGVVVNNAIVLLDYTRQLQLQGKPIVDAAVEAGVTRLRPVLLTAITTILGLVPMVTGISYDFHIFEFVTRSSSTQWWKSMASAVIFGLGFATLLTLIVVPALYVMMYSIAKKIGLGKIEKAGDPEPHQAEVLEDF